MRNNDKKKINKDGLTDIVDNKPSGSCSSSSAGDGEMIGSEGEVITLDDKEVVRKALKDALKDLK